MRRSFAITMQGAAPLVGKGIDERTVKPDRARMDHVVQNGGPDDHCGRSARKAPGPCNLAPVVEPLQRGAAGGGHDSTHPKSAETAYPIAAPNAPAPTTTDTNSNTGPPPRRDAAA